MLELSECFWASAAPHDSKETELAWRKQDGRQSICGVSIDQKPKDAMSNISQMHFIHFLFYNLV